MALPLQGMNPGSLEVAYRRELKNLLDGDVLARLWRKDTSLWPHDESQESILLRNLGWLDLPELISPYMTRMVERTAAFEAAGLVDVVFVCIRGANLAAETVAGLPLPRRGNKFLVLDAIDPASIRSIEKAVDLSRTLFIFAAKAGKDIETHALLLYFLDRLKRDGIENPGSHCIAVTEEGSYLSQIALQYEFRDMFFDPPGISPRFSSIIHFGLLFSVLCQIHPSILSSSVSAMRDACRPSANTESNPALALGALLAAGAKEGWDRLALLAAKSLTPLTYRIAQLVGASTGKGGKGIVPIYGDVPMSPELFQHGCIVVRLALQGEDTAEHQETLRKMQQAGVPVVHFALESPMDLAAELFKWELATALACALLEVEPFLEPNIRESRNGTAERLRDITKMQTFPAPTPRVEEGGILLYAEGATRQEISTLSLSEALRTFFKLRHPDGYVAILAYLPRDQELAAMLHRLGEQIPLHLGLPLLASYGPRYLHVMGQSYQGGPPRGLFLLLTGDPLEDIAIPGAGYSFSQLQMALALGDFASFVLHDRPVVRLHLSRGQDTGVARLERVIGQALAKVRSSSR